MELDNEIFWEFFQFFRENPPHDIMCKYLPDWGIDEMKKLIRHSSATITPHKLKHISIFVNEFLIDRRTIQDLRSAGVQFEKFTDYLTYSGYSLFKELENIYDKK